MRINNLLGNMDFPYLSANSFLIELADNMIIVDTGNYHLRTKLLKNLESCNIYPDNVDYIINTHLHFDHCGNNDLFKNAEFYVPRKEYEFINRFLKLEDEEAYSFFRKHYPLVPEDKFDSFYRMTKGYTENTYKWFIKNKQKLDLVDDKIKITNKVTLRGFQGHCPLQIVVFIDYSGETHCFTGDIFTNNFKNDSGSEKFNVSYIISDYEKLQESQQVLREGGGVFYHGHK